ncbi:MAG: hypothetical protein V1792_22935 [Pseudomonadota bacterium]
MKSIAFYLFACSLAALVPFAGFERGNVAVDETVFPGWPAEFHGKPLVQLPMSEREKSFASGFPGRIATLGDGKRTIIMRWVTKPTRKLHPASHCFKGFGYNVRPLPIRIDGQGRHWSCFEAESNGRRLLVYERISDDRGNAWTDVSAWYWAALLRRTRGSWWAVTVADTADL